MAANPAPMNSRPAARSPLELGALAALVTLGTAGILGIVAVLNADGVGTAFGAGFGVAVIVFFAGATVLCALACLSRKRLELVALVSVVVTGVALDLLVLAIWLEIDAEWYGKLVGIGLAWSFFALLAFGLVLAVGAPGRLARWPFFGALAATAAGGLISTYLIATSGGIGANYVDVSVVGVTPGDDEFLRVLGVAFVLIATLWFGAIAAHRYEQSRGV